MDINEDTSAQKEFTQIIGRLESQTASSPPPQSFEAEIIVLSQTIAKLLDNDGSAREMMGEIVD